MGLMESSTYTLGSSLRSPRSDNAHPMATRHTSPRRNNKSGSVDALGHIWPATGHPHPFAIRHSVRHRARQSSGGSLRTFYLHRSSSCTSLWNSKSVACPKDCTAPGWSRRELQSRLHIGDRRAKVHAPRLGVGALREC